MTVFAPIVARTFSLPTSKRPHKKRLQQKILHNVEFTSGRVQAQATGAVFPRNRTCFKHTQNRRRACAFAFGGLFGGKNKEESEVDYDEDGILLPYKELATTDTYQVRLYDTHLNISAPYETRPEGLAAVAAYMDGANSLGVKIPATQPLMMRYVPTSAGGLQKTISLYVPRAGSEPPPMPSNAGVELEVCAAELVAVLSFSGSITPEVAERARSQLLSALAEDGVHAKEGEAGVFRVAQYGQIFTLKPRRNELWLTVDAADAAKFIN